MTDHDIFSPYDFNTISSKQLMRIRKISLSGLSVDSIPISENYHHKKLYDRQKGKLLIRSLEWKGLSRDLYIDV